MTGKFKTEICFLKSVIKLLPAIAFFLFQLNAMAQLNPFTCRTTHLILTDIKKDHYYPPSFDATTRKEVVKLFLENFDPSGFYFLSSDQKALDSIVSVESEDAFCTVIEKSCSMYLQRTHEADSFVNRFLSTPLDFTMSDTFFYKPHDPVMFRNNVTDVKKQLSRKLKFNVLVAMHEMRKDSTLRIKETEMEEKARTLVLKRFQKHEHHLSNGREELEKYISEKLWNALALRCDPHSNYFNFDDKQDFEKSLSSEELSYGLVIEENDDGEIEIVKLIPGSPAWKANDLNVGDIITGITTPEGKKIDFSTMSEDEISAMIESDSQKRLQFDVKKKNNVEKKISLVKEKLESESNVINGYILKDSSCKVGYIPLPSFYTDFESNNPLGCANDVAKEILKLKKENIKGLIIDLRNNGGGSLSEAMSLAGIFIDEGPLGIIKSRDEKPKLLRDFNRGTVFDGPLLILINGLSASASEFLSAVLQDYKRAVLVGGTTYGKGTGQDIIPVDSLERNSASKKSGYLKLTGIKFYRVNNSTNQAKGVVPDINLPDLYMHLDFFKEAAEPFHLLPDTVSKKVVYNANADLPIEMLREKSKKRSEGSAPLLKIRSVADSLASFYTKGDKIVLNKKSIEQYFDKIDTFDGQIDKLSDYELKSFDVINNQYLNKLLTLDSDKKEDNAEAIKKIKSDAELEESYFILKDLINHSNTNSK